MPKQWGTSFPRTQIQHKLARKKNKLNACGTYKCSLDTDSILIFILCEIMHIQNVTENKVPNAETKKHIIGRHGNCCIPAFKE